MRFPPPLSYVETPPPEFHRLQPSLYSLGTSMTLTARAIPYPRPPTPSVDPPPWNRQAPRPLIPTKRGPRRRSPASLTLVHPRSTAMPFFTTPRGGGGEVSSQKGCWPDQPDKRGGPPFEPFQDPLRNIYATQEIMSEEMRGVRRDIWCSGVEEILCVA